MRANRQWGLSEDDGLAGVVRSLAHALEVAGYLHPKSLCHVKGHGGNPWNELADSIACYACSHEGTTLRSRLLHDWICDLALEHLWLLLAALREPECWPRHSGDRMVDSGIVFPATFPHLAQGDAWRSSDTRVDRLEWRSLRVASLNVQALDERGQEGASQFAGRAAYLRDQFASEGVGVVPLELKALLLETTSAFARGHLPRAILESRPGLPHILTGVLWASPLMMSLLPFEILACSV